MQAWAISGFSNVEVGDIGDHYYRPSALRNWSHRLALSKNSANCVDSKMDSCVDSFHVLAVASVECKDSGVHSAGDHAQLYADLDGDAGIYHCSKTPSIHFEAAWSL
jgi:hypothetical protein